MRVSAGADALLRSYPMRQTMLLGAQLSLGVSGGRWHAALALDGALGRPSVDLGAVSVRMLGGGRHRRAALLGRTRDDRRRRVGQRGLGLGAR